MRTVANLDKILELRDRGAYFYIGHSAGKDSMAMYEAVVKHVPWDKVIVMHADLGDIEYAGNKDFIRKNIDGRELHIAESFNKAGDKVDLFDMIRARRIFLDTPSAKHPNARRDAPAFPSSAARFCTSDLKTGPIWREIRRDGHPLVVNCVGIHAEESKSRAGKVAKKGTLNINKKNTVHKKVDREAYDWWPIAHWKIDEVWAEIAEAGKEPHPAYANGNERLSCVFCIFGSPNDLANGAKARPDLLAKYIALEEEVRGTMFNGASLLERIELNPKGDL